MFGKNFPSFAFNHWSAFVWIYLILAFGSFANYLHAMFGINDPSTGLLSFLLMEFKPQDAELVISSWLSIFDFWTSVWLLIIILIENLTWNLMVFLRHSALAFGLLTNIAFIQGMTFVVVQLSCCFPPMKIMEFCTSVLSNFQDFHVSLSDNFFSSCFAIGI